MTDKKAKLPTCKFCGNEFIPRAAWQKFCSDAHRQAYFQQAKKKPARKPRRALEAR